MVNLPKFKFLYQIWSLIRPSNNMFKITLVTIGKIKDKNLASLKDEYLKRLKPYAVIREEELKPESFSEGNREKVKTKEGERILFFLEKHNEAEIFLLAERGVELNSIEFSKKLAKISKEIIFVIAGALGFSDDIINKYNKLSLSKLTFTHEMARIILLEQIYRATTIANNKNYHY